MNKLSRERWRSFFQSAEIDIEDTDSYRICVTQGPIAISNSKKLEQPLVILTTKQAKNFNEIKPWKSDGSEESA